MLNRQTAQQGVDCLMGFSWEAVNALLFGIPGHRSCSFLCLREEPGVDRVGSKVRLWQGVNAGGHRHRFCVQSFVTGVVEGMNAPFVVCLNPTNSREKGACPVAAGVGGEQGLSKCQWNRVGWWTIGGLQDITWHIQVADPQDFH